jgi:hypothetical protein
MKSTIYFHNHYHKFTIIGRSEGWLDDGTSVEANYVYADYAYTL